MDYANNNGYEEIPTHEKNNTNNDTTYWNTARKRLNYYLNLNKVSAERQHHIIDTITKKARTEWHSITSEDEYIKLFINEAQLTLFPETSRFCSNPAPDNGQLKQYMGHLRSSTGPSIHRSSIRTAKLEKIPVSKFQTRLRSV
jgi:hypothetical protein